MDWTNFWTAVSNYIIPVACGAILTFLGKVIKDYIKLRKDVKELKETNKNLQKSFYKQSLWQVYSNYVEVDREIPEDRYSFAKHCLEEYKKLTGNGTTEFYFEKLDQKYQRQQEAKKDIHIIKEIFNPKKEGEQ